MRDAAATLSECLTSLQRQTLPDFEIVAVDDGSSDASPHLLASWARREPRLRLLRTPRSGLVAALNLGARQARGELIARMDADDVAAPERLAAQAARLRRDRDTAILGSRVRLLGRVGGGNDGMRVYVEWQNQLLDHDTIVGDLLVESPLVHPSVMLHARALEQLGGYRDFDGPEDYDLWLRAHQAGLRFAKLPEHLLGWRDGPDRLSRCDHRYAADRFRALKMCFLERGQLAGGRRVVIWGAGRTGKAWARQLLRRGHRLAAFVDVHPRRIGERIHGAAVVGVAEAGLRECLHLAAVGQPDARRRIRGAARELGLIEGRDLVAVA